MRLARVIPKRRSSRRWTKEQFEEKKAGITKTTPLGRWAHSEEIAKAAVFLASEEGGNVAGIELFVEGGAVQV
jgi:NAD(P)-dependent dehydrogenase (short-subunit alcohol dehydrogenase family)